MKNFISVLTFFILANNVYAANWSFLGETDEYRFELDLDSIKKIKRSEFGSALLHKDLKCKAPLIEPNLRRNLGKWST